MRNPLSFLTTTICVAASLVISARAELPKIQLQQVFPKLHFPKSSFQVNKGDEAISAPLWICQAPDDSGRFFVIAQDGIIYVLNKNSDGSDAKEFLNIVDRNLHFNREDGLLGMAFHPGFKTNGLFYICYTLETKSEDLKKYQNGWPTAFPDRDVVSEFKVSATDSDKVDLASERVLMDIAEPSWNHKGGELQFGPDGYLYIGLGDGGVEHDPFGIGQNTATVLGKFIRIDVNSRSSVGSGKHIRNLPYGIPSDNPFVHEPDYSGAGTRHEIWAYGLRNPWRWSFDRKTGALWAGDVGQDLWEEIDLIVKGGNYGWGVREAAHYFKPGPDGAKYIDPVMEYPHKPNLLAESLFPDHGIGTCVTGGYVYRGKKYPSLDGIYIYADYTLGTIWGFRYDSDAHKVTEQGLMLQQNENITSFGEDNDDELYVLMEKSGHIFQITVQ